MKKSSILERLEKRFPRKSFPQLITVTKVCPLVWSEIVVYSALLFWLRLEGASFRRLGTLTGLDRLKTIPSVVQRLAGLGLVEQRGDQWFALPPGAPHDGWFFRLDDESEQPARYAYNRAINPANGSPLRLIDCAVLVADTITPGLLPSLLAARFRVSVKTIVRSRKKLKSLGEPQLSWFADRPPRRTTRVSVPKGEPQTKAKPSVSQISESPRVVDVGARADTIMRALRLPAMCRSAVKEAVVRMTKNEIRDNRQYGILARIREMYGHDEDALLMALFALNDRIERLMSEHRYNSRTSGNKFGDGSGFIFHWLSQQQSS